MAAPTLHDLACVVHLHSTHSDGTGTVREIAAAAAASGVDVVLLTDHDTLAAKDCGEEGYHGDVLVLVGEEVTPRGGNHLLAFGTAEHTRHRDRDAAEVSAAVRGAGGICFAAHPFSEGSPLTRRAAPMPYDDLANPDLTGIELWSFVTDTVGRVATIGDAYRFVRHPERFVDHPPARNVAEWDRLCAERPLVAIGGLDAHQVGKRVLGRVPLKLMSYRRSFATLRTHVLCERSPTGDVEDDAALVYRALAAGSCYLAMDSIAPASGFAFWAESASGEPVPMGAAGAAGGARLRAKLPHPAEVRVVRNGEQIATLAAASEVDLAVEAPGPHRLEARLHAHGAPRTWILSNPLYLR